jgi:hypothetical protein
MVLIGFTAESMILAGAAASGMDGTGALGAAAGTGAADAAPSSSSSSSSLPNPTFDARFFFLTWGDVCLGLQWKWYSIVSDVHKYSAVAAHQSHFTCLLSEVLASLMSPF